MFMCLFAGVLFALFWVKRITQTNVCVCVRRVYVLRLHGIYYGAISNVACEQNLGLPLVK